MNAMSDIDSLPTLKAEQLTPCVCCRRQLLASGVPLFYRFGIKRAGIDSRAIMERVGLINIWGNAPGLCNAG